MGDCEMLRKGWSGLFELLLSRGSFSREKRASRESPTHEVKNLRRFLCFLLHGMRPKKIISFDARIQKLPHQFYPPSFGFKQTSKSPVNRG